MSEMKYDLSEVMITEEQIAQMVEESAAAINADYGTEEELVVISVLNGAFMFTADLLRALKMPIRLEFVQCSSYSGTNSTGSINMKKDFDYDITGKNVLIVEDIIDTGNTLSKLKKLLQDRGAKSVKLCTAFDKPDRRVNDLQADYNGIVIPDEFIVGYGLDFNERHRDLKEIRIVKEIK